MVPTNRLIKRMRNIIVLLSMQVRKNLAAELQLFSRTIIFHPLALAVLLWRISIGKVLGRGWVNFAFWAADRFIFVSPDDGDCCGETACWGSLLLFGRGCYGLWGGRWRSGGLFGRGSGFCLAKLNGRECCMRKLTHL